MVGDSVKLGGLLVIKIIGIIRIVLLIIMLKVFIRGGWVVSVVLFYMFVMV